MDKFCAEPHHKMFCVLNFFSKQKLLLSSKYEVACSQYCTCFKDNGTHDSASYDLNRLDTETKGIYTFFTLDLVSNFQLQNCVPFPPHFILFLFSLGLHFCFSLILAPELCSRRDHLDVGWKQACGCQAYSLPPADVLQDSQGQGKTMWQSPNHLSHGRTLRYTWTHKLSVSHDSLPFSCQIGRAHV